MVPVVIELPSPRLSRLLVGDTDIGQEQSINGIADAVTRSRGRAEDVDLVLAAVRHYASLHGLASISTLCDSIEDALNRRQ